MRPMNWLNIFEVVVRVSVEYCMWYMGKKGFDYKTAKAICYATSVYTEGVVADVITRHIRKLELYEEKSNYWGE